MKTAQALESTLLVVNVARHSVTLIDPSNSTNKISLRVGNYPHEVVVTPNGQYALVSNFGGFLPYWYGHSVTAIDIKNAKVIQTIETGPNSRPHGIAFISDQRALITAHGTQELLVIDFDENFLYQTIHARIPLPGEYGAHMVTIDKEKNYAYVASFSGSISKIDIRDFSQPITALSVGSHTEGLAVTGDGKTLYVANSTRNRILVIDTQAMSIQKHIATLWWPSRIVLDKNEKSALIVDTVRGKMEVLDLQSSAIKNSVSTTPNSGLYFSKRWNNFPVPVNAVFSENDKSAYVTNLFAGSVTCVNTETGAIEKEIEMGEQPDGIDITYKASPFKRNI